MVQMLFLIFLPFWCLLLTIIHFWAQVRFYFLGLLIPGPSGWPIFGSALSFSGSLQRVTNTLIKTYEEQRKHPVFKFWLFTILVVCPTEPNVIHEIFTQNLNKPVYYSLVSGQGLLQIQDLDLWAEHRRIVGGSFHHSMLKSYIRTFFEEATILCEKMKPLAESKRTIETHGFVGLAALATLVRTMFGVDLKVQQNHQDEHPYLEAVESSFRIVVFRIFNPWLLIDPIYTALGYKAQTRRNRRVQREFILDILDKVKRKTLEHDANVEIDKTGDRTTCVPFVESILRDRLISANGNSKRPFDLGKDEIISDYFKHDRRSSSFSKQFSNGSAEPELNSKGSLGTKRIPNGSNNSIGPRNPRNPSSSRRKSIRPRISMSDRDLLHEMVGLLNAGFDTVTMSSCVVLNILAVHPEIQEQVYTEIQSVLGDNIASEPSYNQLQQLDLLTRVIKEALRLYPAAPVIARISPVELNCGGYRLPAGSSLVAFIYGIHRDPKYWPNPNQFDPDRFLPSECAKRSPHAYLPFSLGPRNCIGHKFALLYLKVTVCTVLTRYRLEPGNRCRSLDDIRFETGMTMKPLPGNDIRIVARSH